MLTTVEDSEGESLRHFLVSTAESLHLSCSLFRLTLGFLFLASAIWKLPFLNSSCRRTGTEMVFAKERHIQTVRALVKLDEIMICYKTSKLLAYFYKITNALDTANI